MKLEATVRIKGRSYDLSLDTEKPDRNYADENYAEWFVTQDDGRLLEITVWKDGMGRFTMDCVVEAYRNKGDFEDGKLLDVKRIKVKMV